MESSAMADILKQNGMGNLCNVFEQEKITPDIVGELSVYEFEQLGVRSRNDIMALRVLCSRFGSRSPVKSREKCGAPKFVIPKQVLQNLLDEGFLIKEISSLLSVSESTIYRRMGEYGLRKLEYNLITDDDLDREMTSLSQEFPYLGENMLQQMLNDKGIKIPRKRLRDSLHRVNEEGINNRKKGCLHRRVYNVKGPNHLWHIDTNHKLVRWYFVIIGGIDGFSRLAVFLECRNNNKAETVYECFLKGIEAYGIPSRVRSDKGGENVMVADFMIKQQGPDRNSMITGKSTHNQRIERLWRDVFTGVLSMYYQQFYFMEEQGILDHLDERHILALHYVFQPLINAKLQLWRNAWARHRMRTTRSTPLKLWVGGQYNHPQGIDVPVTVGSDYGTDSIHPDPATDDSADSRPIFNGPVICCNDACMAELKSKIPQSQPSSNFGIDHYLQALDIITKYI